MSKIPGLPDTVSWLEFLWSFVALCGMVFTLIFSGIMLRAVRVMRMAISRKQASYAGPRWKFVIGLFIATLLFFPGWLAFFLLGVIAGFLPPTPSAVEPGGVETLFGLILWAGEIFFAAGQTWLVIVWWMVRRAPGFIPSPETTPRVEYDFSRLGDL